MKDPLTYPFLSPPLIFQLVCCFCSYLLSVAAFALWVLFVSLHNNSNLQLSGLGPYFQLIQKMNSSAIGWTVLLFNETTSLQHLGVRPWAVIC